ncbi:MAG: phage holin family protein [Synergistaceae bacterium]|nr:phage holin family protein [Synergistaceae bacterium]MBQ3759323.1 phage holin family protein [Synergistaceae bacterium]MBQ6665873.1 phage holin family protein [Synergistaceae bacterium]
MSVDNYISGGAALFGAFLSWYIGELSGLIKLLLTLAVIDQITGVMKGFVLRKWSSEIGFHGIAKKVLMFIFVGVANIIDNEMLGHSELLKDAVCFFYIANEGLSIIENSIELGLPVPDSLKERFMSWRNKQLVSKNTPEEDD